MQETGRTSVGELVLVVILVVVAIVIALAGLGAWIRRARSCRRIIGAPAGEADDVFLGGIMCKTLITSGLLVRLELHPWGVRVRGISPARWVVPTWEARYEDLAVAEMVASPFSRIAVWLRLREQSDGMGFLSQRSEEILGLLEKHEVPVNRSVRKFKRVDELYQLPR